MRIWFAFTSAEKEVEKKDVLFHKRWMCSYYFLKIEKRKGFNCLPTFEWIGKNKLFTKLKNNDNISCGISLES